MIRCRKIVEIARPLPEVFAYVDDFDMASQWMEHCVLMQQTSPLPRAVGSELHYVYRQSGHSGETRGVVAAYEPNRRLVMKFADPKFDLVVDFEFEPSNSGTMFVHTVQIEPRTLAGRMMSSVIRSATQKQMSADAEKLRGLLESVAS